MVLYGLFKIAESLISVAKISIGPSFSCPVTHVFINAKMLLVVLIDLFKIAESLWCRVTQSFIIDENIFLVIDGLSFFCPVIRFLENAVIFLEVIYYLLKMLETGIFTTKTKTGISFTCLVTEFLGYVKMSVISRYSFFAISLA